jgi:hypothetical protein
VYCNQIGYTDFIPQVVNRTVLGTNNYKPYYKKFHPGIPTTLEEAAKKRKETQEKENKAFFKKLEDKQTHDQRYRTLLLEFITKNNLSFDIISQPETKALILFLFP